MTFMKDNYGYILILYIFNVSVTKKTPYKACRLYKELIY